MVSVSASSRLPADFRAQAEALGSWLVSAGGRYPSRSSADAYERGLAAWRYNRLRQLGHGLLPSEHERYLDVVAPRWRAQGGPDMFRAQADELGRWLRSVGAPPDSNSADADERRLATWRYRQTRALNVGTLLPEHKAYLDQVAPGWRTPRSVGFRDRADELGRWVRTVGRWPAQRSADPHERSLCSWRRSQVRLLRTGTLPSEHEAYLDRVAPGWRPTPRRPEAFPALADALGRWIRSTGGPPSLRSTDADERELAAWRKQQIKQLRTGTLPSEHEAYLDRVAPGWRPTLYRHAAFRAQADELGRWMRSVGEVPSRDSADERERRLAHWRGYQVRLARHGTLPPERETYLAAVAPGWSSPSREEVFRSQAEALGRWFASTGGQVPSANSDDPHERQLGIWRTNQFSRLHDKTLSAERERHLDAVAPGWRPRPPPGPDELRSRDEALGRWLASADGAIPSRHSDDPHERWLAQWREVRDRALRAGTLPPENERYLDEVAPGWRPRAVDLPARARALGRWMVWSDGRVPSGLSDDWYERRLNRWRRRMLLQLRTGTLPSEHERYLDEVAPGWRPRARSGVDEFPDQAVALGRWLASTYGRLPSRDSDDLHERRLYRWRHGWLFHLRNGTLSAERERHLDEVAPGWRPRRREPEAPHPQGADLSRAQVDDLPGAVEPPRTTDADQPGTERVSTTDGTREGTKR